jgi:hypothetical protein
MRKLLSTTRKLNLLFALELLDEMVRRSAIAADYLGSTTELAVSETITRARQRSRRAGVEPRCDQMPLLAAK